MVRPCSFVPEKSEDGLSVFSDTTKRPLWQAGDLSYSGPPGYRFPRGIAWKLLLQELPAIQRLLRLQSICGSQLLRTRRAEGQPSLDFLRGALETLERSAGLQTFSH